MPPCLHLFSLPAHVASFCPPPPPPPPPQVAAIIQEEREERALRKAEMEAQKVGRAAQEAQGPFRARLPRRSGGCHCTPRAWALPGPTARCALHCTLLAAGQQGA